MNETVHYLTETSSHEVKQSYIEFRTLQSDTGLKRGNMKYQDRRGEGTHIGPSASQLTEEVVPRFLLVKRIYVYFITAAVNFFIHYYNYSVRVSCCFISAVVYRMVIYFATPE